MRQLLITYEVILPTFLQAVHKEAARRPCEEEALEGTAGIREPGGFKSSGLGAQMLPHIAVWQWSGGRRRHVKRERVCRHSAPHKADRCLHYRKE
ncbi:hypothetical protein QQF64_016871 [Cirrhinus molitorella]|uniref:Secreted protein n=1 Tax=Cirrhinus molitorella TaxID=172907 RepID=A0ABR3LP11_9TELE